MFGQHVDQYDDHDLGSRMPLPYALGSDININSTGMGYEH